MKRLLPVLFLALVSGARAVDCAFPVFAPAERRDRVVLSTKGLEIIPLDGPGARLLVGVFWEGHTLCVKTWAVAGLPLRAPKLAVQFSGRPLRWLPAKDYARFWGPMHPDMQREVDVKLENYWREGMPITRRGPWWTCFAAPPFRKGDWIVVVANGDGWNASAQFAVHCWSLDEIPR